MKLITFLLIFLTCTSNYLLASNPNFLFKNKLDGYKVFRIPSLVMTKSGKILAFCEGRKSLRDAGNIDLVMKTSSDLGKTWSELKVVWNWSENTCGNPSPVVDQETGDILVLATLNNNKVFVLRSKDEGTTWEDPLEITETVKPESWVWYATGPVHAIQLKKSPYENRLVVPCNHTTLDNNKHRSHIIYSDDGGYTWRLGGQVSKEDTDECTVAELSDGSLLLNMRNKDRSLPNRKMSWSEDGGESWTSPIFDTSLIEPICQGSLLRYSMDPTILLFANPKHTSKRKNLTLSISKDEGETWSKDVTIYPKKAAYNDLIVLNNGDVLCIFETGKILPYSGIAFTIIKREMIVD